MATTTIDPKVTNTPPLTATLINTNTEDTRPTSPLDDSERSDGDLERNLHQLDAEDNPTPTPPQAMAPPLEPNPEGDRAQKAISLVSSALNPLDDPEGGDLEYLIDCPATPEQVATQPLEYTPPPSPKTEAGPKSLTMRQIIVDEVDPRH